MKNIHDYESLRTEISALKTKVEMREELLKKEFYLIKNSFKIPTILSGIFTRDYSKDPLHVSEMLGNLLSNAVEKIASKLSNWFNARKNSGS